ncbi:MAG: transglutaminase domain-containing protein, partial [Clostridia bacterium]|nr:transglutaminase domain-containing protein [Clostridia bacterium]
SVPGTAAFVAAAVVFSLCAAPAAYLKWPAPELTVFNDVMDRARDFLYGYISGEGPMNIDESADLPYKSAEPAPRKFRNKKILTVTASDWSSLYLRSWIGEEYSGDKWTASNAETEAGVDLVPEEITELFFTIVDNSFNQLTRTADMADERLGFVTELVTVKSDALGGDLALLPSRFSPSYGITVPGRLSEQYPGYSLRNGVGVAEMRMTGARYTVVSYAQNYKNISLYRINNYMTVYELVLPYVMEYISDRVDRGVLAEDETEKLAAMKEELAAKAEEAGVAIPYGCLINRIGALYDSELRELRQKLDDVKQYEDYVYGRCLSRPWRDITVLQDHALAIYGSETADASSMKPSDVYTYADKTARYLNSLCTYTLEPTGYTENGSVLSQFLTTAKNGYCVQYATAGAMLLRTIGIPTRFADGYLASNFTRQRSGDYRCTVLDTNAHAWIEVYVRNYGWMTFEMTGPMLGGIYSSSTPELIPETEPVSPQDDPETSFDPHSIETTNVPPHGETSGPDTGGPGGQGFGPGSEALKKTLLYVGIAVLCVAAVATVIYLYLKYVTDRKRKRSAWLKDAANGLSADPGKDTEKIKERIFFLFGLIGKERGKNELMSDFAERIDRELNGLKSFAPAAQALQKHSFGHCADKDDCAAAADYCSYLAVYVRSRLNRFKKFIYVDLRKLV